VSVFTIQGVRLWIIRIHLVMKLTKTVMTITERLSVRRQNEKICFNGRVDILLRDILLDAFFELQKIDEFEEEFGLSP
jgi:hypothetical protein